VSGLLSSECPTLSPLAQQRHGFTVGTLPTRSTLSGNPLSEALADNTRSPVPDQVHFRIDFLEWLVQPASKQGFFYPEWTGTRAWKRVHITADMVPRISKEFLEEERAALGERWFLMEYFGVFGDALDALFREADIKAAMANDLQPLFGGKP
jgi:hypothetical protein